MNCLNKSSNSNEIDQTSNQYSVVLSHDTNALTFNRDASNQNQQNESNDFISFLQQQQSANYLENDFDYEKNKYYISKQEHIININSGRKFLNFIFIFERKFKVKIFKKDDEEYTTCSVVLENISGSARTDYKSNHTYIEKYKSKRKQKDPKFVPVKRIKSLFYYFSLILFLQVLLNLTKYCLYMKTL